MRLRILIASGPTQEPIDPVRYLSNYSTGTMGRRLYEAASRKHKVTWVQCPQDAQTARELLARLKRLLPTHEVLIMAAAVCDVRPVKINSTKIKKEALKAIRLVKNPDILAELSKIKKKSQVFIGFGLESSQLLKNGFRKLQQKNLELILLQRVTKNSTPFGEKSIEAVALDRKKSVRQFHKTPKATIARFLIQKSEEFAAGKRF